MFGDILLWVLKKKGATTSHTTLKLSGVHKQPFCLQVYICFSNWETQKNIDKIPKNILLQLMYGSHNLWWGSLVFNRTWLKAFLFGNVFRFFCLRLCAMIYRSRFWWGVLYCDFQSQTSSQYVIWFENLKFKFLLIESSRLAVILS